LDLNQSASPTLTLASGQTLKGNGTLAGTLVANSGSTVAPGASVGALTVSGSISLAGTTIMEISKTAATNDVLRSTGSSITYGGTLIVTNLAGTFVGGESYKLFNAQSYSGPFAMNLPPLTAGLSWNTNNLTVNGTISVSGTSAPPPRPRITSITQSGTDVIISGTNNSGLAGSYYVLATTNRGATCESTGRASRPIPLRAATSAFTNGVNLPQRFYLLQLP
jgi:hypothetical protein